MTRALEDFASANTPHFFEMFGHLRDFLFNLDEENLEHDDSYTRGELFKDDERKFTKMEQKGDWPQWKSTAASIPNMKSESCICCVSARTSLMPSEKREVMHAMQNKGILH